MRRSLPALVAVALVVGGVAALRALSTSPAEAPRDSVNDPVAPPAAERRGLDAAPDPSSAAAASATSLAPRPRSLRGTRVDGELTAVDGRLVVTDATRRFFDYFLTATGEESPEAMRARIVAAIARRLPPAAARDAEALLDRYLRYRERARDLAGTEAADDLAGRLDAVVALRREVFGPDDAAALFADEEAVVRTALAEHALREDATLSAEERALRLSAIEEARPAEERATRAAAMVAVTLRREEAALRERGGSADELRALREQVVGPEAAARLAALDQSRAEWQQRVDAYRAERAAIDADPSLTPAEHNAAIDRLLEARFSPPERLRVQALDEIANSGPGASDSGPRAP